jgi:hypothetical protein
MQQNPFQRLIEIAASGGDVARDSNLGKRTIEIG